MNDETETDILLALQATAGALLACVTTIERLRKRVAELEAREQRPDPRVKQGAKDEQTL